jgi:superfamily II DNA/RNA helicase
MTETPRDMPVDPDPSLPTFSELGVSEPLTRALARGGITHPSAVQAAVLPDALAGHNVLGKAATGSGKTLAFGLPVLARLAGRRSKPSSPRAVIIVPTRELAGQVRTALDPLAAAVGLKLATVYGGTPYDKQIKRLRAGVDIIVATPGRLEDLIKRRSCRLDDVEIVVLDEADHLCDLGFYPAVSRLVAMTPDRGQRLLLSATLDGDVNKLVRQHVPDAVTHEAADNVDQPDIDHHVLVTGGHNKIDSAADLLRANPRSIVFTRTRRGATALATGLAKRGIRTVDLHGNLSQNARERNLRKFSNGQADVVVATDVAARGIHVDGISLVVHYDAPTEQKAYLHRSGRTARAGNSGTVITMTTESGVHEITRLHRSAGVSARHHDARTAPDPMTPESLSSAGTDAPEVSVRREGGRVGTNPRSRQRRGGSSTGRGAGSSARTSSAPRRSRGSSGSSAGRGSSRDTYTAGSGTSAGKQGAAGFSSSKQRWSSADKRARASR